MVTRTQARQLRDAVRHLVVAHGALNVTCRPCGAELSVPHAYALLELLQAPGGMTSTALATRLSIDRTNVSRLIARMEAAGQVRRRTDSNDGRAKRVTLTARGKRVAQGVDELSAAHFAAVSDGLALGASAVLQSLQELGSAMTALSAAKGGASGAETEEV